MTEKHPKIPAPNVREYAQEMAFGLAREQLAGIKDPAARCRRCGAEYLPAEKAAIISYLNRPYSLSLPGGEITAGGGGEVPPRDRLLMLHYFIRATGAPLSGRLITYQELPDGLNYFPVFSARAIKPIVDRFGAQPERLIELAGELGGRPAAYGDAAATIDAFARVPLTIVLWRGDEEFAPSGSLMFDATISEYLSNDDIHALCENIAWKLAKMLKSSGGDSTGQERD